MPKIGNVIDFQRFEYSHELKDFTEKVITLRSSFVDEVIVKALFETYKDTDISKIFIIDETNFNDFLNEMLPQWLTRKDKAR